MPDFGQKHVVVPEALHRRLAMIKAELGLRSLAAAVEALVLALRGQGPLAGRVGAFGAGHGMPPGNASESTEGR